MMQLQSEWADGGEAYGSTQVADNPQQPCGGHGQGCHGSGLCFPSLPTTDSQGGGRSIWEAGGEESGGGQG